jgi:hypothetical protein
LEDLGIDGKWEMDYSTNKHGESVDWIYLAQVRDL